MDTLNNLPIGSTGKIISLETGENSRRRMLDLGFVSGSEITSLFSSPFGDPVAYLIKGTIIAIRNEDAKKIKVSI